MRSFNVGRAGVILQIVRMICSFRTTLGLAEIVAGLSLLPITPVVGSQILDFGPRMTWAAIVRGIDVFISTECQNYFAAAGYSRE